MSSPASAATVGTTSSVEAGWSMLVRGVVESIEIDEAVAPVAYVRGSYRQL